VSRFLRRDKHGRDTLHRVATYYEDFSSEHEFLLELFGDAHQEQSRKLQSEAAQIDWNHLFAITPPDLYGYLGYKLTEVGLQNHCPRLLLEETLNARRGAAAQWLRFRFELRRLAAEFARHNTEFLLLKGAVLAFLAYPDSSLRPVFDIDILVQSGGLSRALECIYAAGFECPERYEYAHPASLTESAVPGEEISFPLEKEGTRALLEVHTQLESTEPWFPVAIAQVWECAEEADLDGVRARIPEQHEFLFHLILHLARGHLFAFGLRPLLDVHLWVELRGRRLDWERIASESVHRGYGDWVYLTLKMVRDMFGTPIPQRFFDSVPPPVECDRLQRLAYEQVWADRRAYYQVPVRLALALSQPSWLKAVLLFVRRLQPNSRRIRRPTIPPLPGRSEGGFATGFRRAMTDLNVKAPQYFRVWRNGGLVWSNLRQAARLVKGRNAIKHILLRPHGQNYL
jgi:hypothetical protein